MDKGRVLSEYSDEQLAAVASGDAAAASELMARLFPHIRAMAASIDASIKDDLLQEGLLAVFAAIDSYDPERSSVRTYALACARNRMLSTLRRNRLQATELDVEVQSDPEDSRRQSRQQLREVYCAMERILSRTEREVMAYSMMGCSYGEISRRLGISVKSVDNALQRARRKLRREFDR